MLPETGPEGLSVAEMTLSNHSLPLIGCHWPRNFVPSCRIYLLPWNFVSAKFHGSW